MGLFSFTSRINPIPKGAQLDLHGRFALPECGLEGTAKWLAKTLSWENAGVSKLWLTLQRQHIPALYIHPYQGASGVTKVTWDWLCLYGDEQLKDAARDFHGRVLEPRDHDLFVQTYLYHLRCVTRVNGGRTCSMLQIRRSLGPEAQPIMDPRIHKMDPPREGMDLNDAHPVAWQMPWQPLAQLAVDKEGTLLHQSSRAALLEEIRVYLWRDMAIRWMNP